VCREGVSSVPCSSLPSRPPLSRRRRHGITVPWMDGGSAEATPDDSIKAVLAWLQAYLFTPVLEYSADPLQWWRVSAATYPVLSLVAQPHHVNPGHQRTMRTPAQHSWCHHLTLFPMCQVSVIGISGYSDDITISSWTLSRYCDAQKVHDSSHSRVAKLFECPSYNYDTQSPGLADLNQGDLNQLFKSRFKSNDFFSKKIT